MTTLFLKLLNMSITAGWMILAVLAIRVVFKKAPKAIFCVLWMLVGIRLVCPFSFESVLSLVPSAETVNENILYANEPEIHTGISAVNSVVNPVISEKFAPEVGASVNPMQIITSVGAIVWVIGAAVLLIYAVVSYLRLKRRVGAAMRVRDNIWICDDIESPFILGFFRPRIYLQSAIDENRFNHVIAHENAHIKRRDHWWKPIGFVLLAIYWFNPLIWAAYILLCRDIEMACDERVIKEMGLDDKKEYAEALISCSVQRRIIAACPLAFGEVSVKVRIKKVLDYKKPGFWVIVSALLLCTIVILCFLTNPKDDERYLHEPFSCHYEVANVVYDSPVYSFSMTTENAPEYYFSEDYELMILEDKESDNWLRAGEFARIELTEDNFDNCFVGASGSGWGKNDARRLRENNDKAWEVHVNGDMNGVFYYLLLQKNGDIYLTYGYSEDAECSIRWVFALEQSELYKYISLADICNELDTDSVEIFDIQEIENRLYVGCAYEGKYGIAFYKKAENGEYILDTVKPQKKFYSRGVDIWAYDYVSADDDGNLIDNKVFIVANEDVMGMEWTGDHEESIVISRYPTLVVVDYLKGTGDEQSSYEFVYKETTGLLSDMYVSAQCLYMNMLSSQFWGADSGYKYKITDTGLVLVNRKSGAVESIVSADPGWREFPYSDDEWRDLFVLPSSSQINISNLYDEMLHFRVSEKYSLFKMDEQLWIAEFKENPQMGRFLWSIYALVPESSMGSAVWEYAPMFSSKSPMFKFDFDFDFEYGELSAVCVTGTLISADEEGQPSGSSLIISEGNALYWVPYVEEGPGFGYAQQAEIMFTVNDGDKMLYDGTIYISVDSHRDASVFYGATIVSGGLHMTQSETDGAIICPA